MNRREFLTQIPDRKLDTGKTLDVLASVSKQAQQVRVADNGAQVGEASRVRPIYPASPAIMAAKTG
jgi:hypothetical protein